jgi:hypothetical protein
MKFDSNLAWQQASGAISANREVVLALAGVFFMLPSLGLALIYPAPEPAPGTSGEETMAMLSNYFEAILPFLLPMVLFQAVGTLGLLTLLTDRKRPTVGEAIGQGVRAVPAYVLAQLIVGFGSAVVAGVFFMIGAAMGVVAITMIGVAAAVLLAIYVLIRTSLVGPVIMVEQERNAFAALSRSWRLTRGNAARIGVFYLLVGIAFLVVMTMVMLVVGIPFALFASAEVAKLADVVVSSGLNAVMALYFVAIVAAAHRQLAGSTPAADSDVFS